MGQIANTLLEGTAQNWFTVQGNTKQWTRLQSKLLTYLKPADNAFKTRQALSCQVLKDPVTNYINGFNERYIQCADVDSQEAMFRFMDGLEPTTQDWVRVQKPRDLRAAMQAAEELGSTLATVG